MNACSDFNAASPKGYTALVSVMFALHDDEKLLPVVALLVTSGATLDCETDYGESPLSVALRLNRFDAVRYLLNSGADPSPLKWTAMLRAVALGTCEDVQRLLETKWLGTQDRFGRSPWLLAACVGDVEKAELLRSKGADLNEKDRMGDTSLMMCCAH